jgi:hypothetical protein
VLFLSEDGSRAGFQNEVMIYKTYKEKSKKKNNLTFVITQVYMTAKPEAGNTDERNTKIQYCQCQSSADKVST